LLVQAVRYAKDGLQMPPDQKLAEAEIRDLEEWVRRGTPDPRDSPTQLPAKSIDWEAARQFWSFQKIQIVQPPSVSQPFWPNNPIDHFILARLDQHGLQPAPPANKRVLLRRATYDLTGLPPTVQETEQFLADDSPGAFDAVVERLLASKAYGQRWGRYWMDVVRYADTAGDNSDFPIPQMHLYRDWIIDSLQNDMPYDQFVRHQLAGDLLPFATPEQRRSQVIATGYLAASRRFGSRVDDYPQHLTIEDTIDNLGRAFLGLTINCSRCHDHKFDPITAEDYYALYGIFQSTRYPWPGIELEQRQRDLVPLADKEQVEAFESEKAAQQKVLDAEHKRLEALVKEANAQKLDDAQIKAREVAAKTAKEAARKNSQRTPPYEMIFGVTDYPKASDAQVHKKGDPSKLGDAVPRRFLAVLGGHRLSEASHSTPTDELGSGRLQLVDWLLHPENPLPARVMANRIWQYHFGKGIVPTPSDFGKQGKPPTHPDLLDWLADRLVREGWSIKAMHRWIMRSKTYQMASLAPEEFQEKLAALDPNNDLLSVFPRRRLDAEAIRDTILYLGGSLQREPGREHPFPPQDKWAFTQHNPFKAVYESNHRSVYLMTQRIQRHPFLAIFDGADPSTSTPRRASSTTPLQALFLLNDPLLHEQANKFARRLIECDADDAARVRRSFAMAVTRYPEAAEVDRALRFVRDVRGQVSSESEVWEAWTRVLFRLNEWIYVE
jgi:hypothetical protein